MANATQLEMQKRQQALAKAQTFSDPTAFNESGPNYPGFNAPNTQGGYNGPVYGAAAGNYLPYSQKASYEPYQELGNAAGAAQQSGNSNVAGSGSGSGGHGASSGSGASGGYTQGSNGAVITSAGDGGTFDAYNPGRFKGQGNDNPQSGPSAGSGYSGFGQGKYVGSEQFYSSDALAYNTGSGTDPRTRRFNMEGRAPGKQINEEYSFRGMSPDAYNGGGGDRAAGRNEWGLMDENDLNSRQSGSAPGYRQDYGMYSATAGPGYGPPHGGQKRGAAHGSFYDENYVPVG